MTRRPLFLFDKIILGYLVLLSILILIFGRPLSDYYHNLLINVILIAAVISIISFLNRTEYRLIWFFRLLYPGLLFTIFYEQTGGLMKLFFPGFLDYQLTAFEKSIFGIDPSLWLDRNLLKVWLTEILSFCYFSYYTMLPIFLIVLFLKKRYDIIKPALSAICLTFFASFILFFLYPIEGPRWFLADQYIHKITGPVFRPLVDFAISNGAVRGGCMPSSHVAVGLVILFFTVKHYRKAGWILIPVNIGLALGTVYGRFHYVSDVIVGALIGITFTLLIMKYHRKFDKSDRLVAETGVTRLNYVSGII